MVTTGPPRQNRPMEIELVAVDITGQQVDAIVNAANSG